jgi:hypothetical protein
MHVTQTFDPGIMKAVDRKNPVVISITCQRAPVAIGTIEQNEAALRPAKLQRRSLVDSIRCSWLKSAPTGAHEVLHSDWFGAWLSA